MYFMNEDLKSEIENIRSYCDENEIAIMYESCSIFDDPRDLFFLNEDSKVNVYLPGEAYAYTFEVDKIPKLINEARNGEFLNEYTFFNVNTSYIRIDVSHDNINFSKLNSEANFQTSIKFNNITYVIDLVSGLNSFNIKLAEEKKYSEHVPPYLEEDIFLKITGDNNIDSSYLDNIFNSYFFELKSIFNFEIKIVPWEYDFDYYYDEEITELEKVGLRPLLQGKGINEILNLYKTAFNTSYSEQQILSFSRIIEYVSQTVIRKDLIDKAMMKLSSKRALAPDSSYILELNKIFDDHRDLGRDYQAFKITIETCCDILELVEVAPLFLKKTKKLSIQSKTDAIDQAYNEIIDAVTATRNKYAHAKTNYTVKGTECPENQLKEFTEFLDMIAQQTIRWFSMQKEDNRIV